MRGDEKKTSERKVYQPPAFFVRAFYGVLLLWTVGTAPPIYLKFLRGGFQGDWLYGLMFVFFYLYTWFWSLGIVYRIALDGEGRVRMNSVRRTLEIPARQIRTIEGSKFPGGFGFIRVKLPRESVYLFCYRRDEHLDEIVREIRRINPLVRTARL